VNGVPIVALLIAPVWQVVALQHDDDVILRQRWRWLNELLVFVVVMNRLK